MDAHQPSPVPISSCALPNQGAVQKTTRTQQRPPRPAAAAAAADPEPIKIKEPLPSVYSKSVAVKKAPLQRKTTVLKTPQEAPHHTVDLASGPAQLEPIKIKNPLPSVYSKSVAVKKAPLQRKKTTVLLPITKTTQKAPHHTVDLQQGLQKKKKKKKKTKTKKKKQCCHGQHMATADALLAFGKHLTPFEQREIKQYKEVWYLGIGAEKIQGRGYDDVKGHYKRVIKDHIAYRYEVLGVMGKGTFGQVLKCRDHKTKQLVAMKVVVNNKRYHLIDQAQRLSEALA
ncbi:Dual specificity tyrosine-phosphorylation-regulated kinase 4 [Merluccius polli]|uniref:dual-specificity kinase n=1 Tax=Merluccius polli TaxID=89951 RepID=A0AA47MCX2_MERPO|nr:Dual specificity tyrosine-phosphorylation-regulated kinase 4 [Merluccius polli]